MTNAGAHRLTQAIRVAGAQGRPALLAYFTAGVPDRASFTDYVARIAREADVVEIGVPFSDPMADGVTIQRASRAALAGGASLAWILEELAAFAHDPARRSGFSRDPIGSEGPPTVLMSYMNPLLAFGIERLAARAAECGVSGLIVPDLPLEESEDARDALESAGVALVQLVSPLTPDARLRALCSASRGFVYAVTTTGTTGREGALPETLPAYLARVRAASALPVCAGFGIRRAEQVRALAPHVDGVIVGSALVEACSRGEDPAEFLRSLRAA